MSDKKSDERSKKEAERIRDEALKRALSMPPKPHAPKPKNPQQNKPDPKT